MRHVAYVIDDTINRSDCSLRNRRPALIRALTRQKPIAPEKYHAYRQNAGQPDPAMSAKGGIEQGREISPGAGPTYKSP